MRIKSGVFASTIGQGNGTTCELTLTKPEVKTLVYALSSISSRPSCNVKVKGAIKRNMTSISPRFELDTMIEKPFMTFDHGFGIVAGRRGCSRAAPVGL